MELAALEKQLRTLQTESTTKIGAAASLADLEELGSSLLGKKGALTDLLRGIGLLSAEDRPKIGALANEVRAAIEAALESRRTVAGAAELSARIANETEDATTPGPLPAFGSLHPIPETISAIARPEPQPMVQPRVPWPALTHRPLILVWPINGMLVGVAGRKPVQ